MAAPFPPQGNQKQHTEKPLKVYAEQYVEGQPLPVGAVTETLDPVYADGRPHVITADGRVYDLQFGDWVISNRYTGALIEVISDEEFSERFGGGGGPNSITGERS
jgi:hypothetical protein